MINGEGIYVKKGKSINCVWYDDVKFELKSGSDEGICCDIFGIIFEVAIYALIGFGIISSNSAFFIGAGVMYIINLFRFCCSPTR
jgi:hypothetical protein